MDRRRARWCSGSRPNVRAALDWIDRYGDRDGDGYVEYQTRSPQGLGNQCWRDSWDGVQFADGRMPYLPIATCELQGYVYDAKRRVAELADGPLGDPALATRLRAEASTLREQFNRGLLDRRAGRLLRDRARRRQAADRLADLEHRATCCGAASSPDDRAGLVVRQLMSDAMFSGWGVRTLSTQDRGFNPIGYHLGTVWPHDNSLIALGLARYGYREEANRIALAQIEAAAYFELPPARGVLRLLRGRCRASRCRTRPRAARRPGPPRRRWCFLRAMLGLDAAQRRR